MSPSGIGFSFFSSKPKGLREAPKSVEGKTFQTVPENQQHAQGVHSGNGQVPADLWKDKPLKGVSLQSVQKTTFGQKQNQEIGAQQQQSQASHVAQKQEISVQASVAADLLGQKRFEKAITDFQFSKHIYAESNKPTDPNIMRINALKNLVLSPAEVSAGIYGIVNVSDQARTKLLSEDYDISYLANTLTLDLVKHGGYYVGLPPGFDLLAIEDHPGQFVLTYRGDEPGFTKCMKEAQTEYHTRNPSYAQRTVASKTEGTSTEKRNDINVLGYKKQDGSIQFTASGPGNHLTNGEKFGGKKVFEALQMVSQNASNEENNNFQKFNTAFTLFKSKIEKTFGETSSESRDIAVVIANGIIGWGAQGKFARNTEVTALNALTALPEEDLKLFYQCICKPMADYAYKTLPTLENIGGAHDNLSEAQLKNTAPIEIARTSFEELLQGVKTYKNLLARAEFADQRVKETLRNPKIQFPHPQVGINMLHRFLSLDETGLPPNETPLELRRSNALLRLQNDPPVVLTNSRIGDQEGITGALAAKLDSSAFGLMLRALPLKDAEITTLYNIKDQHNALQILETIKEVLGKRPGQAIDTLLAKVNAFADIDISQASERALLAQKAVDYNLGDADIQNLARVIASPLSAKAVLDWYFASDTNNETVKTENFAFLQNSALSTEQKGALLSLASRSKSALSLVLQTTGKLETQKATLLVNILKAPSASPLSESDAKRLEEILQGLNDKQVEALNAYYQNQTLSIKASGLGIIHAFKDKDIENISSVEINQKFLDQLALSPHGFTDTPQADLFQKQAGKIKEIFFQKGKRKERKCDKEKQAQLNADFNNFSEQLKKISTYSPTELKSTFEQTKKVLSNPDISNEDARPLKLQALAAAYEAMGRSSGKYPNETQILAVLLTLDAKEGDAINSEIATGEGKSLINLLKASLEIASGKTPIIATSSRDLVQQGMKEGTSFLNALGVDVYENPIDADMNLKDFTPGRVYYGVSSDISFFYQQHEEIEERGHQIQGIPKWGELTLLIDEVDAAMNTTTQNQLATPTENLAHSGQSSFYAQMYGQVYESVVKNITDIGQAITQSKSHGELYEKLPENLKTQIRAQLNQTYLDKNFNGNVEECIAHLVSAAYTAHTMASTQFMLVTEEARDPEGKLVNYKGEVIEEDMAEENKIPLTVRQVKAIDPQTGTISQSVYGEGVHSMLAIRLQRAPENASSTLAIPVPSETQTESVRTIHDLVASHARVFGDTGTYGKGIELQTYEKSYTGKETTTYRLPKHYEGKRLDHDPQFFLNEKDHQKAVLAHIQKIESGDTTPSKTETPPHLIACSSDESAQKWVETLKANGMEDRIVFIGANQENISDLIEQAGKNGKIIVSARINRGIDIKPEHERGLIVTVVDPDLERKVFQTLGRTNRKGAAGETYQFYNVQAIRQQMGKENTEGAFYHKYHYFGNRLLKKYYKQIALKNQTSVLDNQLTNKLRRLFIKAFLDNDQGFQNPKNQTEQDQKAIGEKRRTLRQQAIKTFDDHWGQLLKDKNPEAVYEQVASGKTAIGGYKLSDSQGKT